jgi:hypothetical protein
MTARSRKFVGMLLLLAFIVVYVGIAAMIGERLPHHWAAQLAFYLIAGLGWGVPVLPLLSWMNRGR